MNANKRCLLTLVLALALCARPTSVHAASALAGALEPTQVANFIQLIQQAVKLGQQVRKSQELVNSWKTNLARFENGGLRLKLLEALVNDTSQMYGAYNELAFGRDASLETFKKRYPGYAEPPDRQYAQAYRDIDKQTLGAVERGLKQFDIQLKDKDGGIKAENQLLKELAARADSADGVVKALGVTNDLLILHSQQLQKLQMTMTAQAQTMAHYVAGEVQRRSYEDRARDEFFKFDDSYRAPTPVDWSVEGGKGLL